MRADELLPKECDASPGEREAAEIVKLIRKLRWIGKDDEARSMEHRLQQSPSANRDSVVAESCTTD
jgi:hypothetical protein